MKKDPQDILKQRHSKCHFFLKELGNYHPKCFGFFTPPIAQKSPKPTLLERSRWPCRNRLSSVPKQRGDLKPMQGVESESGGDWISKADGQAETVGNRRGRETAGGRPRSGDRDPGSAWTRLDEAWKIAKPMIFRRATDLWCKKVPFESLEEGVNVVVDRLK